MDIETVKKMETWIKASPKRRLRERGFRFLRRQFKSMYSNSIMNPIDKIYHIINGRSHYPPYTMKERAGNRGYTYEASGRETLVILKLLCGLKHGKRVLEIGCGPGKMAFAMIGTQGMGADRMYYVGTEGIDTGGWYFGTDINKSCIDWCQKNITPKYPNYRFIHVKQSEKDEYTLPFEDDYFDIVFLHSVFTHMSPEVVLHYLREIKRVLKPKGKCCATFVLITEHNKGVYELTGNGVSHWTPGAWAYEESYARQLVETASLRIVPPIHNGLRSQFGGLINQDLFILEKES